MIKLIKLLDDHYIVVDDSEIKEGDWISYPNLKKFVPVQYIDGDLNGYEKKITHSNKPLESYMEMADYSVSKAFVKIKPLSLSEIEEAIYGYSLGKMAELHTLKMLDEYKSSDKNSFIEGFKAHQELVKDKIFTKRDMIAAFIEGTNSGAQYNDLVENDLEEAKEFSENEMNNFIQSLLPKTEWEVEFDEQGKLKLK